jgi:hypothetical protein
MLVLKAAMHKDRFLPASEDDVGVFQEDPLRTACNDIPKRKEAFGP